MPCEKKKKQLSKTKRCKKTKTKRQEITKNKEKLLMLLLPRENFPHVLKDKHITKNRAIRKCDSVLLFSGTIITGRKALSEESGLSHVMKQSIQLVYVHEEKTSVERTFLHLAIDEHGTSPRTRKYSYL